MKNIVWAALAMASLGALGTSPAYASGTGGGICSLPIIGKWLCPPPPGTGGGGGRKSVPEPATLAVLAAGACAAGIAARRRRRKTR
jgi:hypothetical protein